MDVLVTGGAGNVGHHLVPSLLARGDRVRVLALPGEDASWLEDRGVTVFRGDVRRPETLAAPMRGVHGVIHMAGLMGVWRPLHEYHAVNVMGTENVCRAALGAGIRRLVHVSSWTVYGTAAGQLVREDFPLTMSRDPYLRTKAGGDKVVQRWIAEHHLPAVIVRPGTIFGTGDRLNFARTADRLRGGKAIIVGSGRNAMPLVYVTDVVQGLLLALDQEQAAGKAYNIGNDRPLTQREFLRAIAEDIGVRLPRIHVPYRALHAAASAAERVALMTNSKRDPLLTTHGVELFGTDNRHSIDKAKKELGYTPQVPLREGVRRAAEWYRSIGRGARLELVLG
jgi:nucleoside-diphosphate-sugar epimerase